MSVAKEAMPPSSTGVHKAPLLIGVILIVGGLLLLSWLGWVLFSSAGGDGAPYYYKKIAEGGVGEFSDLVGLKTYEGEGITIRKYELIAEEVQKKPLVEFYTGSKDGQAPVLLEWKNNLREPVLTISGNIKDLTELAQAITKHASPKAVVLGWWDISRRLELLTGVNTLFHENLAQPLLIPAPWAGQRKAIEELENQFWQVTDSSKAKARLKRVAEALLADEVTGTSMLRELAGGREAYVVIHYSDAYKLGVMEPKRFGIGYKDFPGQGDAHALIPHVKEWVEENGYKAYLVERVDKDVVRAYFLIDDSSKSSLIAKMLPFSSSNPMKLKALHLLAQYGGYWVYSLSPADDSTG
ncbi:MAG: hydroxylamine oxidation protein HaoB [Candidatus Nitrosoglobus sp.]